MCQYFVYILCIKHMHTAITSTLVVHTTYIGLHCVSVRSSNDIHSLCMPADQFAEVWTERADWNVKIPHNPAANVGINSCYRVYSDADAINIVFRVTVYQLPCFYLLHPALHMNYSFLA